MRIRIEPDVNLFNFNKKEGQQACVAYWRICKQQEQIHSEYLEVTKQPRWYGCQHLSCSGSSYSHRPQHAPCQKKNISKFNFLCSMQKYVCTTLHFATISRRPTSTDRRRMDQIWENLLIFRVSHTLCGV